MLLEAHEDITIVGGASTGEDAVTLAADGAAAVVGRSSVGGCRCLGRRRLVMGTADK